MLKLVIHTQYKENYAAHDEDYVHGVSEPYWKFKGGSVYVIEDIDFINTEYLQGLVDEVSPIFVYSNPASECYVIDWELVDHDENPWDEWDTPYKLIKGGKPMSEIAWTMSKFTDNTTDGWLRNEIANQRQTWFYTADGKVKSYHSVYEMTDGQRCVGQKGLEEYFNNLEVA